MSKYQLPRCIAKMSRPDFEDIMAYLDVRDEDVISNARPKLEQAGYDQAVREIVAWMGSQALKMGNTYAQKVGKQVLLTWAERIERKFGSKDDE